MEKAEEPEEAEALMRTGKWGAVSGWKSGVLQVDPRGRAKCPLSDAISCKPACL